MTAVAQIVLLRLPRAGITDNTTQLPWGLFWGRNFVVVVAAAASATVVCLCDTGSHVTWAGFELLILQPLLPYGLDY